MWGCNFVKLYLFTQCITMRLGNRHSPTPYFKNIGRQPGGSQMRTRSEYMCVPQTFINLSVSLSLHTLTHVYTQASSRCIPLLSIQKVLYLAKNMSIKQHCQLYSTFLFFFKYLQSMVIQPGVFCFLFQSLIWFEMVLHALKDIVYILKGFRHIHSSFAHCCCRREVALFCVKHYVKCGYCRCGDILYLFLV